MSVSTDEMYNSSDRYLHEKFNIHFSNDIVLEVLKSNYLVSSDIIEETFKSSNSPFGDITSNELSLSLMNENGLFNPKNTSSPYYGLIRRGIQIEAFIRPDEVTEWDRIGVYYVTDWNTSSSGTIADVTACDALYSVLNAPVPSLGISKDIPFTQFITEYFALFDLNVTVDAAIQLTVPYVFTSGYTDNRRLLADLMIAAIADCFCLHDGSIAIVSKTAPRSLRATITDDDQIVSAAIKQTIATDYDSAQVTCNAMQESAEKNILSISDLSVAPGITNTELTSFSSDRVASVRSINIESEDTVKPVSFDATADHIICNLQSTSDATVNLNIIGTVLESVSSIVSTEGTFAIEINSAFVQTQSNARSLATYVDSYVNEAMPTLDLSIRGNPRLELGSLIRAKSDRYKVDFTGVLTKVKYAYAGGLHCDITLTAMTV